MSTRRAIRFEVMLTFAMIFVGPAFAHEDQSQPLADTAAFPESAQRARLMIDVEPGSNPWTSLDFLNDPEAFQFAIVTDRTGGHRVGVFNRAIDKLNMLQPEFVVSVGDLIEGRTQDEAEIARQWDELESMTRRLEMPFFYVAGNHDYWRDAVGQEAWHQRFGRTYYSFVYHDVLVLCLNTEDPPHAHISEQQAAFVRRTLAEHANMRWTLVFMHQPLWLYDAAQRDIGHWADIEAALKDRPHTVYAGHWHRYAKHDRNGREYYVLATTGGAQGQMARYDIPASGTFDHVVWVTMTARGPRMANLLLEGILPSDVATAHTHREVEARVGGLLNSGIYVEPLFASDAMFTSGTLRLHLRNHTDQPMDLWAMLDAADGLTLSERAVVRQLEPDAREIIEIDVTTAQPLAPVDVPAIAVRWGFAANLPSAGDITQRQVAEIRVARRFTCAKLSAGRTITIDGDLGDWSADELAYDVVDPAQVLKAADTWMGADDLRFRFGVVCDDEYLYIAVRTYDDRLVTYANDDRPWQQDGIEVRLDARPEPDRSAGTGHTDFAATLLIGAVPVEPGAAPVVFRAENLPDGVRVACVLTDDGHVTEIAIPHTYLDETQGEPWKAVRLSVGVNDRDDAAGEEGEAVAQIHWLPDWRMPENYAGSGTFMRE